MVEEGRDMEPEVYDVPAWIDERVAGLKLRSLGLTIDSLTDSQVRYLKSWDIGT